MTRYFTADPHLLHEKVAKIRFPFSPTPQSDMLSVFMRQVDKLRRGDQLWILGDLTRGSVYDETLVLNELRAMLAEKGQMAPQLHLITGNHDTCSPLHKDGWKRQGRFLEVFSSVQQYAKLRINGTNVLLSHFPYANLGDGPDREGARYLPFRLADHRVPLVHGHTHQSEPHAEPYILTWDEWKKGKIKDKMQYCVSWDVSRGLVHENTLGSWVSEILTEGLYTNV